MNPFEEAISFDPDTITDEGERIDYGLTQMEMLYRSRCIQPQGGNNVTVREIPSDAEKAEVEKSAGQTGDNA